MRRHYALALAIGQALLVPAYAQIYTSDQAVAHALAHNPGLAAAAAETGAAVAQAGAAQAGRLPQVDVRYTARRSDNPLDAFATRLHTRQIAAADFDPARLNHPDPATLHATELTLTWPLYTGGRTGAVVGEARENEAAARLELQRAREVLVYRTRAAYLAAQAAAEAVRIQDQAVAAAQRHADTTGRLLRERRIVSSDKLTADVNLALIQANREQAATRARNAATQLRLIMGLPAGASLELVPWREPGAGLNPAQTAALERMALEARADVKAQAARANAGRERVAAARAAYQPQVSVGAAQSWYDDNKPALDNSSTAIMGTVSLNLYNGGRDHHTITAARERAQAEAARLEAAKQQALNEVHTALAALEEARTRVDICADNVGKAQRTVELVQGRYGEGRTILIDLLQAERTLVEARMEKLNASLNLATAELGLALASGSLELPQ